MSFFCRDCHESFIEPGERWIKDDDGMPGDCRSAECCPVCKGYDYEEEEE